jgi:hypothetical protein
MPNIERIAIIQKSYKFIFSPKFMISLSIMGAILFFASLWNRFIYIDDAFFGEQSYWLAKEGVVKIPSMIDFLGCENHLFSYHKLNIFLGAGLIKIFGWSVTPLRAISILFYLALLLVFIKYIKENKYIFTHSHLTIAIFFISFNPLIYLYAFTFRPEIWVAFFGFCSYYFLEKTKENNYKKYRIFSGLLAGMAFLTHLNGLIFPVAGFVLLALTKRFKEIVYFSVPALLISALYFWDLWQGDNFSTWLFQLKNWPDNNATNYLSPNIKDLIINLFSKLLNEHQRFFWSDRVWGISLFFLIGIIINFRFLYNNHQNLLLYTIILILTLNIAGGQIAERFLIYFFPFFSIIIAISIVRLFDTKANTLKAIYSLFLILHFVFVIKMFLFIYQRSNDYPSMHDSILAKIPDKKGLVLAPYEFVFNGLENYNLASYKGFEYYEVRIKRHLTQDEFFSRADSLGVKYVVISESVIQYKDRSIPCLNGGIIKKNPYYMEFYRDDSTLILKKVQ